MRIALDAMGGDHAPDPIIEGAIAALEADAELEIALVGERHSIERLLESYGYSGGRIDPIPSDGVVQMDEKPTEALRRKPNCSIAVCWKLMAGRKVDAVVSAGNTGAVVAAGLRTRLFLKGVKRPAIAVALPTMKGRSVLLDVGANPAARPEHLVQYGVMGEVYAREVFGIESPKLGLMNIGSEESKGNDLYREAHSLLSESRLKDQYVGNIEGRGLYQGDADVLICEGFVGNVVLKVSEGMAEYMMKTFASEILGSLDSERQAATQAFQNLAKRYQYNEEGGALLLGIDGICIIAHGSSNALAVTNALKVAVQFQDRDINSQICAQLEQPVAI